jgi:alkylhydroperoxidase family enzyme
LITHNDAPHSVGPLWTSDQLVAKISTWQHTTNKHSCLRWDSKPRPRPRGYWDRHEVTIHIIINVYSSYNVFITTSLLTGRRRGFTEQSVVI